MGSILIGTASWTDKSLIDCGRFYPPTAKNPEDRLRFYASQFPTVEVDSSYYALPSPAYAALWAERTPKNFLFNVKAFRLFTGHQTPVEALPRDIREAIGPSDRKNVYYKDVPEELRGELWRRFKLALAPLQAAGKLCAVHFQFAPWFTYSRHSQERIKECAAMMDGFRLAVEFRHASWFTEKHAAHTLAFERECGLVNVIVDEPQGFKNSIPAVWEVTNPDLAIVRLHGRNSETWNQKGLQSSADRFNYDYSTEELTEIARSIFKVAIMAGTVQALLNNNYEDQGQRNARELRRILDEMEGSK